MNGFEHTGYRSGPHSAGIAPRDRAGEAIASKCGKFMLRHRKASGPPVASRWRDGCAPWTSRRCRKNTIQRRPEHRIRPCLLCGIDIARLNPAIGDGEGSYLSVPSGPWHRTHYFSCGVREFQDLNDLLSGKAVLLHHATFGNSCNPQDGTPRQTRKPWVRSGTCLLD